MGKKPGLDAAYGLHGPEDVKALYRDWAGTYDTGFVAERGYVLHEVVAAGFVAAGGAGPVLDVGAGTGLVGAALARRGLGPLHATDISAPMLAEAEAKGCYADLFEADITQPLACANSTYGGVVSAGTFTLGHLGPDPLAELVRITRPGGVLAIAVNAVHYEAAGFAAALAALGPRITGLATHSIRIYAEDAAHDHAADLGLLVTFRAA
ncbi:MAG: class I SAM-dependent methyltransferase [Pseudomonadota bacterium]